MSWVVGIMPVDSVYVKIKGQGHRGRKTFLKNPHINNNKKANIQTKKRKQKHILCNNKKSEKSHELEILCKMMKVSSLFSSKS